MAVRLSTGRPLLLLPSINRRESVRRLSDADRQRHDSQRIFIVD